eukprot:TRINITY_DN23317_c0_g1_i1.p1 TRINITY_DN23317_c0_g1~~TRINITY_DN23317_c0_g1_i1.p1  ORF type:complete len:569 (+),score=27.03 TRINITY_DN23317_c0_g1_i1:97-1803(+)
MGSFGSKDRLESILGKTYGLIYDGGNDKEKTHLKVFQDAGLARVDAQTLSKELHFTTTEMTDLQEEWKQSLSAKKKEILWTFMKRSRRSVEDSSVNENVGALLCELLEGSETLNFPVALQILSTLARGSWEEQLSLIFSILDPGMSGYLLHEDVAILVDVFYWRGEDTSESKRDHVFQQILTVLDINDDGKISWDELLVNCQFVCEQLHVNTRATTKPADRERVRNTRYRYRKKLLHLFPRGSYYSSSSASSSPSTSSTSSSCFGKLNTMPVRGSTVSLGGAGSRVSVSVLPISSSFRTRSSGALSKDSFNGFFHQTGGRDRSDSCATYAIDGFDRSQYSICAGERSGLGRDLSCALSSSSSSSVPSRGSRRSSMSVVVDPVLPGAQPTFEILEDIPHVVSVPDKNLESSASLSTFDIDRSPSCEELAPVLSPISSLYLGFKVPAILKNRSNRSMRKVRSSRIGKKLCIADIAVVAVVSVSVGLLVPPLLVSSKSVPKLISPMCRGLKTPRQIALPRFRFLGSVSSNISLQESFGSENSSHGSHGSPRMHSPKGVKMPNVPWDNTDLL